MNIDSKILREQIDYLTKKLFGTNSEKTAIISGQIAIDGVALGQFDEAEVEANPEEIEPIITKKKTRKGYSREKALINLPEEDKVYTLSEEAKICTIDGDNLRYAGKKDMRSEIEYAPATMKLVHIYEESWECRTCRKEGRPYFKQAKIDTALLQHSMASPSSVAWTMYQKYVNHIPLYRQEKDWQNLGMEIKRSTLSNWILKTSEEWLSTVVTRLHENLLKDNYLHADETPIQVMNEEDKKNTTKSYMWVYTTSIHSDRQIQIFEYRTRRAGVNAADFLDGYTGYLHTDGYKGYGKAKGITRCLCWSHARRYFADAMPKDLKSADATLPNQGLAYCNKLFEIEKGLKDLSAEDRKEQRLKLEKPVLEAFWSWVDLNINVVLSKSKIGQALQYVKNQQSGLMAYLEDGNCEISNNLAENSIRPFTVGRKNWLFAGSPKGATASATVYSLVETAKANGLNPYKYLQLLLTALPKIPFQNDVALLDTLLPWESKVQEICKIK
ncbi:IS66 family transposase [Tissierella praeacuta]|uniref:IS66 family transposase n=1 Tax=Tissierella praeacuta TaxID=43131 RepID=UPI0028AB3880|nr:IS66 family transposase [Tissierella praeacuta]